MGIKLKFIDSAILTTLTIALLCFLASILIFHIREGLSIFVGSVWGASNLFFLKHLLQNLLLEKEKRLKLSFLFLIKWPLLYFVGFVLLKITYLLTLYLLLGFSLIFLTISIFGIYGAFRRT